VEPPCADEEEEDVPDDEEDDDEDEDVDDDLESDPGARAPRALRSIGRLTDAAVIMGAQWFERCNRRDWEDQFGKGFGKS
jgi:hypothetical protein